MTTFAVPGGDVTGEWNTPASAPLSVIVFAHGAGGTYQTPQLRDLAVALAGRGHAVLRFNFPYTEAGRKAPDRAPKLVECFRAVADQARATFDAPLFLGGRSMGGRMASHLAADGYDLRGLIFLAYPLHPPGKPERIRDEHLPAITAPMLWVQGTRDTFATPDLLAQTAARLPRVTLHQIDGADHSFKVRGRPAAEVNEQLAALIDDFCTTNEQAAP